MTIVDDDTLAHANLGRHILNVHSLGENKAQALASHLNKASAHASVGAIPAKFPSLSSDERRRAEECDMVLECTGDDETLHEMSNYKWTHDYQFASISLSYRAKRIYLYTAFGSSFSVDDFREQLQPWLERDAEEFGNEELIQAGIGCWHATFPARIDEITMLVAAAVRHLEHIVSARVISPQLAVFEQEMTDDGFTGVRRK